MSAAFLRLGLALHYLVKSHKQEGFFVMKQWNLLSTDTCSLVLKPLYNGSTTRQQSRPSLPKAAILDQEVQLACRFIHFSTFEFW